MSRARQLAGVAALAALVVAGMIAIGEATVKEAPQAPRSGGSLVGVSEARARFAGIPQDGAALGRPGAPVTLVEFLDLQCPFCAQWDIQVMPAVLDRVRRGELRVVMRPLKFLGPDSVKAVGVAGAVALQDRLWQYVDIFFHNQGEENSGYVTDAFLRRVGGAVPGLDVDRALAGRDSPAAQRLTADAEEEAKRVRLESTPSFLAGPTGGRLRAVEVSYDPDEFLAALDEVAR
jgi:protein-disulfide isomerase